MRLHCVRMRAKAATPIVAEARDARRTYLGIALGNRAKVALNGCKSIASARLRQCRPMDTMNTTTKLRAVAVLKDWTASSILAGSPVSNDSAYLGRHLSAFSPATSDYDRRGTRCQCACADKGPQNKA